MSIEHKLELESQPIADQWMAKCKCGWWSRESFWDTPDRDELLAKLRERFADHLRNPTTAP